jgi:hypothetical protein
VAAEEQSESQSHARDRRRFAIKALVRSFLVAFLLVVAFFLLPLTSATRTNGLLALVGGLAIVILVLGWHIRMVLVAPFPAIRAVSALVVTVPLFLIVFATIYYLMGVDDAAVWSEPLTRMDALYFAVTIFGTVGFGDITAVSQPARVVVTIQMMAGLILVGVIARVLVGAVQVSLGRRSADG